MEIKGALKDIAFISVLVVFVVVIGTFTNANSVYPENYQKYDMLGRPMCDCRFDDEALNQWNYISEIDTCWLEIVSSNTVGYTINLDLPFYNQPYY